MVQIVGGTTPVNYRYNTAFLPCFLSSVVGNPRGNLYLLSNGDCCSAYLRYLITSLLERFVSVAGAGGQLNQLLQSFPIPIGNAGFVTSRISVLYGKVSRGNFVSGVTS